MLENLSWNFLYGTGNPYGLVSGISLESNKVGMLLSHLYVTTPIQQVSLP